MLENIIKFIGSSAVLLGFIAWLIRKLTEQILSRDIENYKNNLKILAIEHQIIYKSLHERRAIVISDIYSLMVEAIHAVEKYVSPSGDYKDKIESYSKTMKQILEFFKYFDKNRIFLSEDICAIIEEAKNELKKPTIDLYSNAQITKHDKNNYNEDFYRCWFEAWEKAKNKEIPIVRSKLEEEFRILLGVEDKEIS